MSQKYDAMVDDNNQGIYNGAHDPIIIFNAAKSLREVGNLSVPKRMEIQEVMDNIKIVSDEMSKLGKKVAL